jgi:hypothetical protein
VAGLGLLSSYDSVDIILVSIMPCDFLFKLPVKLHEYATLIQYLYIASLLSWLFFSKLLMPRRSQGFSIKLVLTLMNFCVAGLWLLSSNDSIEMIRVAGLWFCSHMTVYRQHLDGWIMTFAASHNFITFYFLKN